MSKSIVIITGCSTGVGLSTAVLLAKDAQKQYKVYACMRNLAKKKELVTKAADYLDKTLLVLQMDVCDENSVLDAVKQVLDNEGKVDVLINNAGVGLMGALEFQKMDVIMNVFDTNVHGVIRGIRAVLPSMKKQRSGRIIIVSSVAGLNGIPFSAAYSASKFAVEGLGESLAPELAQFNIYVSLIEPGPITTPFAATAQTKEVGGLETSDATTKELMSKTMQGLLGELNTEGMAQTPEEVAEYIMTAIKAEKPHLRYITNKPAEQELKKKIADVTGDVSVEMNTEYFFGVETK